MKRLLFTTYFLLFVFVANAQDLRIVKDNLNCSYGLKDAQGNWVVDPIYILIQEFNTGYFLAKDALGDGLLSSKGEQVIECRYDQLKPADKRWQFVGNYPQARASVDVGSKFFLVGRVADRKFFIDSKGKELLEFAQSETIEFDGETHFFIQSNQPLTTSYFDISGKCLIDKFPGVIAPFGRNNFSLSGKRMEGHSNVVAAEVRVINRNGTYLLDEQFDRAIVGFENKICFENARKYGEISVEGQRLIEPKYRRKARLSSALYEKKIWVIYGDDDKEGLMKPDGTIVLDPIYDQVVIPHWNREMRRWWLVRKDGLSAVYDEKGRMILPLKYDKITFVHHKDHKQGYSQTNFLVKKDDKYAYIIPLDSKVPKVWYDRIELIGNSSIHREQANGIRLLVEQDDKFGILNMNGSILSECVYDNYMKHPSTDNRLFLSKGLELIEFEFRYDRKESNVIPWEITSRLKNRIIFTDSRMYVSAMIAESGDKFDHLSFGKVYQEVFGNMLILNRHNDADWKAIHVKTQEEILLPDLIDIKPLTVSRFQFRMRDNRLGVLNENGAVVIQPIYSEFKGNYHSPHLWAAVENQNGKRHWVLIDERGNQIFSDSTMQTFAVGSGDLLMEANGKKGVFDTDSLKWKIQPIYPCLFQSVGDFYLASFAEDKKGILRSDGTVLLPMSFKSIQVLTYNEFEVDSKSEKENLEIHWIANDGSADLIINQKGEMIISHLEIQRILSSLMFQDNFSEFNLIEPEEDEQLAYTPLDFSEEILTIHGQGFSNSNYAEKGNYQSYPQLDYSKMLSPFNGLTQGELKVERQLLWSNPDLKLLVFDSVNAVWNRNREGCVDRVGGYEIIGAQSKEMIDGRFKEDCHCAEQNHLGKRGYNFRGMFYKLDTVGENIVSIVYGQYPDVSDRFMTMSQIPPPPPPAEHMSFVVKNGKAIMLQLNDIFPSDSILLDEFVLALQKRDDLQLECSSLEAMMDMIGGRFSVSENGLHLYYGSGGYWNNDPIEFLIPLERLNAHEESRWIVSTLSKP